METPVDGPEEGTSAGTSGPMAPNRRRLEWLAIAVAAVVAWPVWSFRGGLNRPGSVIEVAISLVTSDREDLGCALGRSFDRFRCEFPEPDRPWPAAPARAERLAPYMSESRQMFLLPGLFENPAVLARYEREPPHRTRRDQLRRFTALCTLRLVDRVEGGFDVRWVRGSPWGRSDTAWVAVPISCRTDG